MAFQLNAFTNGEALDSIKSLSPAAAAPAVLTSIEVIPNELDMKIYGTGKLGAYVRYPDGTVREITDQVLAGSR